MEGRQMREWEGWGGFVGHPQGIQVGSTLTSFETLSACRHPPVRWKPASARPSSTFSSISFSFPVKCNCGNKDEVNPSRNELGAR